MTDKPAESAQDRGGRVSAAVHIGNVLDILPTLESESVNCVVTSPPYWGLRDYGTDGQLGLEPTPDEYVATMVRVFSEVRRVLRDDGTLWLNLGDSYCGSPPGNKPSWSTSGLHGATTSEKYRDTLEASVQTVKDKTFTGLKPKDLVGIPWRVAFALQADGWYLRSEIIWAKRNCMPESVTDRPTKSHETLFLLAKSPTYFYDADAIREPHAEVSLARVKKPFHTSQDVEGRAVNMTTGDGDMARFCHENGRNKRDVWTIATQPYPEAHFATYPEKLVEPCILAGCPDRVCAACGAPWSRVVERTAATPGQRPGYTRDCTMRNDGERAGSFTDQKSVTLGFRPTCRCNSEDEPDPSFHPGTVLDPFTGSGTTGAVACRLGRNFVGIELNYEYAAMAERRIAPHRDQLQLAVTP